MSSDCNLLPEKVTYIIDGINSKFKFILTVLKTVLRVKPIDLIICGHIHFVPFACFLRGITGAPISLEIHGIDAWQPTGSFLVNSCASKVNAVIAVSELTRKRFLNWCQLEEDRSFLLPNAIKKEEFSPAPKPENLLSKYGLHGKKVLMTLGRMSSSEKYKGFDEVIELLPDLDKDGYSNIVYLAAGDGDDRERLETKAKIEGVADRVIFTGYIHEDEKADHYRLADVYVMPSTGEGFGFVLLEAMACGIPVVASCKDGTREAVKNGELGSVVDPGKPEELKNAIINLLVSQKEVPAGLDYFSMGKFIKRLHNILNAITG